jgi:hypothetical protein
MRLLDFLELEHLLHGGQENGRLVAPYNQLVDFGMSRKTISAAIAEGVEKGLIKVTRSKRKGSVLKSCNRYRLTYKSHKSSCDGREWDSLPTDEWRRYVKPAPTSAISGNPPSSQKGTKPVPKRELSQVSNGEL